MTSIVPQDTVLEDSCPSLGFLSLAGWVPAQRYQPLGPSLSTGWGRFFFGNRVGRAGFHWVLHGCRQRAVTTLVAPKPKTLARNNKT